MEKKTYALLFSVDVYERQELEKLNEQELYDLATTAQNDGYGKADIMTLDVFSWKANEEMVFLENSWLYFVTI